jgi:hypothetical protein
VGHQPLHDYADANAFWNVYQTLLTSRFSTSASGFALADIKGYKYGTINTGKNPLIIYFNCSIFIKPKLE